MKRIVGYIALAVVIVGILAVFLLPGLVPKDIIKQQLIAQVESATGRKLTLGGPVSISLFPTAKVSLADAALSDANLKAPAFITLKSLDVGLELLPLLRKEVIIHKLVLEKPVVRLAVDTEGRPNWLFNPTDAPPPPPAPGKPAAKTGTASGLSGLRLSNVRLIDGEVSYSDARSKESWQLSGLQVAASADGLNAPLEVDASAQWQNQKITLDASAGSLAALMANQKTPLEAKLAMDLLTASFKGQAERGEYSGALEARSGSLTAFMAWLGGKAKPAAGAPLALELATQASCTAVQCDFKKMTLSLDALKATGSAGFNLAGRKPQLMLDLDANAVDLTPFLPQPAPRQAGLWPALVSPAMAADARWSREPMDLSALEAFDATANIKTTSLMAQKLVMNNATLRAKVSNGRLSADVLGAGLYGGKADLVVAVDSRNRVVEKRLDVSGMNMQPFLQALMDESRLSGKGELSFTSVTRGVSQADMVENLQGRARVLLRDGALEGINIADMVRNVQSAFKQVNVASQKTDFAELGGTFAIERGVVRNNDLFMKAPLMRLSGAGEANLPLWTINYRLKPEVVETIQGQDGKDKAGLGVPVIIEGRLDNPTFRPDLAALAEDAIKNPEKIRDTLRSVKEQFKGENKKELLNDLKGAFR
jgi:AsmA protein